ncbi:fused chemotaxis regulator; protein-glutamate methylesterase in two-component regulatory system with CheA [uncultured Defluviicoccus sp.]|uniref:protein-glutamate methylesterase n=1 Tax=metagenome TaxID=256318 RepID=A0A380T854_9ZZZZ|nr:fused chemotaxis regulator; protein-glutamate methylesterase in two-component regulatory system with CheA [uncultured Defluviicoccus sp.]
MKPVKVLVVDDSATMRALISSRLRRDPEIEVVGGAGDPLQAREMIKQLNPDVLTLDVEMPRMNGIEFLERLMRLRPMPVVMVSTLTQEGAETTLQALELGAFDCVGKPAASEMASAFDDLGEKVKTAAKSRVRAAAPRPTPPRPTNFRSNGRIIAVGASTGGVEALITVLSGLPENCPPVVVTQHMPATFTKSFAARLDRMCAPSVSEAEDGEPLKPGRILIAPGGARHMEVGGGANPFARLRETDLVNGHRPSVDVLFNSVAATVGARSVGLILTGMGKDGAKGMLAMRQAGARTFGQDEASCVVYGMPKAAFEIGAVERQAPLNELSRLVLEACTPAAREIA